MIYRWLIFIFVVIILQLYSSLAIKTISKNYWLQLGFIVFNVIVFLNFIIQVFLFRDNGLMSPYFSYSFGVFIVSFIFQIIAIFIFFFRFSVFFDP